MDNKKTEQIDRLEQSAELNPLIFCSSSTGKWQDVPSSEKHKINQELLSSLQMHNLIVLAGCGTSVSAGGPTMKGLWDICIGEQKTKIELSEKLRYCRDNSENNIERFLSLCEASIECESDRSKKSEIEDFMKDCRNSIQSTCRNFLSIDKNVADKLETHCLFLRKLTRRRVRDPRLKVFTTNYDLCFEYAAAMLGLPVIDGFSFSFPNIFDPRYFEYDMVRRTLASDERGDYLEGVFHLYKLHGSLHWYRRDDGRIEKYGLESKDGVAPSMIYPAKGKFQQSYAQPYIETISRFMAALREPNTCLLVIGFGFNDSHLAEPILSAVDNNPHMKTIVVDLNAREFFCSSGKNSNSTFQQKLYSHASDQTRDIVLINSCFRRFVKFIPDLKALSPGEKFEQIVRDAVKTRSEQ
jgi:hypothetical protein